MRFQVNEKVDVLLPVSICWIIGHVREINETGQYYRVELESFEFTKESILSDIIEIPFDKEHCIQKHGTWCFEDWRQNIHLNTYCEFLINGKWHVVKIVYYSKHRQELLLVLDKPCSAMAYWEPLSSKKIRYGWDI